MLLTRKRAGVEQLRARIATRQSVTRARYELEQLWHTVHEVEHLWGEQQQQCLAALTQTIRIRGGGKWG